MKKLLLFLVVVLSGTTISAQKPEADINGIEVGAYLLDVGPDDPAILAYAGMMFPTKYENINWTIGAMYNASSSGYDGGLYGGIDGHWNIFTASASIGLYSMMRENSSGLGMTASIGVRLGWKNFHFKPQISIMMLGNNPFWGIKLPLTFTF